MGCPIFSLVSVTVFYLYAMIYVDQGKPHNNSHTNKLDNISVDSIQLVKDKNCSLSKYCL